MHNGVYNGVSRPESGKPVRSPQLGVRSCPDSSVNNTDIEDSEDKPEGYLCLDQVKRALEVKRDRTGTKLDELDEPLTDLDVQFFLARLQALNQAIDLVEFYDLREGSDGK